MRRLIVALVFCALLIQPGLASADNIARDYIPAAPGCLAVLLYYQHLSADSLYANGDKLGVDVDFSGNVGLFRPVYYMEVGGFTIDPQFIIPFGSLNLESTGAGLDLSSSGVGDPIILATLWLVNNSKSKTWLGFTPFFFLPIGDYDNYGGLTLGENRWRFREEFGFVKGFEVIPGHNAYFELTPSIDVLTENDEFGPGGKKTLSQNPIFNLESHLSYDITSAFFISGDYYSHYGGETSVNGYSMDDSLNTQTLGLTLGFNVATNYQFLFQYKGDVYNENGLQQQAFTARFLYACDVGYLFGKPELPKK